jgi:DNA-directed RNA polymerase I subunit RPA1
VHIYNVTFFDQLLRLLKGQCIYCHRFRLSRSQINIYACKLRLLRYGLVEEATTVGAMELRKGKGGKGSDSEDSEDEDEDDLIKRRNAFVKKCIHNLPPESRSQTHMLRSKNPVAAELRRDTVRDFLKEVSSAKKCATCSG